MANDTLLDLTADIVAAHVAANKVPTSDLPLAISAVYGALAALGGPAAPAVEELVPAVSVRASVKADAITCLECGAKQKLLKRHLRVSHDLSPDGYRARWHLPADYPLVAPNYAATRRALAVTLGLGRKPGTKVAVKQVGKKPSVAQR